MAIAETWKFVLKLDFFTQKGQFAEKVSRPSAKTAKLKSNTVLLRVKSGPKKSETIIVYDPTVMVACFNLKK